MILFKDFRVIDPWQPTTNVTDVLIDEHGIIKEVGSGLSEKLAKHVLYGNQRILSPSFTDLYCNFGEPGLEYRETVKTGANAALAGGFGMVCLFPNTVPVMDSVQILEYVKSKIEGSPLRIELVGAMSVGCKGEMMAPVSSLAQSGVVGFSDGESPVQDPLFMKRVMDYISMENGLIFQIPVDKKLAGNGVIREGKESVRLGLSGIPSVSEPIMVHRDGSLSKATGSNLHFLNITTGEGWKAFNFQQGQGATISASVSPFYFSLSENDLNWYDTNYKLFPPIAKDTDRLAVLDAIANGWISAINSSHTPQSEIEKTTDMQSAPWGAISLETVFGVSYMALVKTGVISLEKLIELLTKGPRDILGISANNIQPGNEADFTVLDLLETYTVSKDFLRSKSWNTPFINKKLMGRVDMVFTKNRLHSFHETIRSDYTNRS